MEKLTRSGNFSDGEVVGERWVAAVAEKGISYLHPCLEDSRGVVGCEYERCVNQQVLQRGWGACGRDRGIGEPLDYLREDFNMLANFWHCGSISNRVTAAPWTALTIPSTDR